MTVFGTKPKKKILGGTPRVALPKSLDLTQHAEAFGYTRYWVAEHHKHDSDSQCGEGGTGVPPVKSRARCACHIMLRNHSPLVIATRGAGVRI